MVAATAVLFLIEFVFGVVEFFIGFRVLLKLFGASPKAPFVSWIYETSQPLVGPFLGMFPSPRLQGGFIIEFSALFGLVVYGLVAYAFTELVRFVSFRAQGYGLVERSVVRKEDNAQGRRGRKRGRR